MSYKVNENCIGCGVCVGICPDVFELGEDGYSHVIAQPEDEKTRKLAGEAKESCPVAAIEND